MKETLVSYYKPSKLHITIDKDDDNNQLSFYVHDYGGWAIITDNVVAGLYIIRDFKHLIKELDAELPYNSDYVINTLKIDGDLNWTHWLSGGNAYWGNSIETLYSYIREFCPYCDDEEEEQDYESFMDENMDIIHEKYNDDIILEQLKDEYEDRLKDIILSATSWINLLEELEELSREMSLSAESYLSDFVSENINA